MGEGDGRRWPIYVCSECGNWSGSYLHRCELTHLHASGKFAHPQKVIVAPVAVEEELRAQNTILRAQLRASRDVAKALRASPGLTEAAVGDVNFPPGSPAAGPRKDKD